VTKQTNKLTNEPGRITYGPGAYTRHSTMEKALSHPNMYTQHSAYTYILICKLISCI